MVILSHSRTKFSKKRGHSAQKSYGSIAEERVEGVMLSSCSYNYWRSAQTGQEEAFPKGYSKTPTGSSIGRAQEVCSPCPFGPAVVPILCFPWRPLQSHQLAYDLFKPAPTLSAFIPLALPSLLATQSLSSSFQARPQGSQIAIPYYCSFKELKILPTTLIFSSEV